MERVDKDSNMAFYDSQRADDRRRFEEQPTKVHLNETIVPWVVSHLAPGARVLDVGGGSGVYASGIVRAAAGAPWSGSTSAGRWWSSGARIRC